MDELQKIYDSGINVQIGRLRGGGIDVALGNELSGFVAKTKVRKAEEIIPWLQAAICEHYADSVYAKNLKSRLLE